MTSSIRRIRGIERTAAYAPIQAILPYAHSPYREGDPQLPQSAKHDMNRTFRLAAAAASEWIRAAQGARLELDELAREPDRGRIGGRTADLLNRLEQAHGRHAAYLLPELWAVVELSLVHPGAKAIGLRRGATDGAWSADAAGSYGAERLRGIERLLLGADGLLGGIKHALTYADGVKTADLLRSRLTDTLPYAVYYGAAQCFWPLPCAGLLLNRTV
ncbi:hypothetical protein [Paenibacillus arenilitoris]|uniref:Uncharacterized protein n=1 Tax=Paenibacillus arenilitoris TaxID=2772299 RepID=A0A927CHY7_9BACL|nr:hypothetical protein [Paenibacillus arenilitoris]MBD2867849.1 hypothetical protein [Paenibacillus arenilitoris]